MHTNCGSLIITGSVFRSFYRIGKERNTSLYLMGIVLMPTNNFIIRLLLLHCRSHCPQATPRMVARTQTSQRCKLTPRLVWCVELAPVTRQGWSPWRWLRSVEMGAGSGWCGRRINIDGSPARSNMAIPQWLWSWIPVKGTFWLSWKVDILYDGGNDAELWSSTSTVCWGLTSYSHFSLDVVDSYNRGNHIVYKLSEATQRCSGKIWFRNSLEAATMAVAVTMLNNWGRGTW